MKLINIDMFYMWPFEKNEYFISRAFYTTTYRKSLTHECVTGQRRITEAEVRAIVLKTQLPDSMRMILEQSKRVRRSNSSENVLEMITDEVPDRGRIQLLRSHSNPALKQGRDASALPAPSRNERVNRSA